MRRRICLIVLAFTILAAAPASAGVVISTSPAAPMMDERVAIAISGLKPDARVTVLASARAVDGLWWRSEAMFVADHNGLVALDRQAPVLGAYRGVDAMGLFWSMRPDDQPIKADHVGFAADLTKPITTRIEVRDAGGVIGAATLARRFLKAGVRVEPLHGDVHGTFYGPGGGGPHPAVLVIGGSDGGPGSPIVAAMLASHGYAVLSLSYFGEPGLPQTLERVPMETFQRALAWMRGQPGVDPRFIAIYAESRGTEPGLYTAARDPGVGAVIARSPSFALWGGVTASHLPGAPAWTLAGKPLADIPNTLFPDYVATWLWNCALRRPAPQTPLFLEDLAHFTDLGAVEIPVERIHGPVLLLSGLDDGVWPSAMMAGRIMARLRKAGHPYADRARTYLGVGHAIPYAYLPTNGRWSRLAIAVGGSPEGMARAQADAWPRLLRFLADAAAAH